VTLVRRLAFTSTTQPDTNLEWLVTNGLGGYASETVSGALTRRFHGLLIAALPAPLGRMMMLSQLRSTIHMKGRVFALDGETRRDTEGEQSSSGLVEFRLEMGLPVWRYEFEGVVLEKRLLMPYLQNSVHILYRLLRTDQPLRLTLRPMVHFRPHEGTMGALSPESYRFLATDDGYEINGGAELPPLRMLVYGPRSEFVVEGRHVMSQEYALEKRRGYPHIGQLWSPGYVAVAMNDQEIAFVASSETWETARALTPRQALAAETQRREELCQRACVSTRAPVTGELALAADQFVIMPAARLGEAARARAAGDEARTVIAGYHWFTDWGRDTMISLEGLTLATGRHGEAGWILRTFAHHVRDGLIPNMFPEGEHVGLYHTADATLWFFHALHRYLDLTGDRATLRLLLPTLVSIIDHHLAGTRFGIGIDPADGLLRQGAEGFQLTWMDAKVGDWVVTPRRGKTVETNALWYQALRLIAQWLREEQDNQDGRLYDDHAQRAFDAFNERFWNPSLEYLNDVVDGEQGDDPACRPNQIFAISLPHPVLVRERWEPVLEVVRRRLLTPVGLRSLSPDHPSYQARYDGDLKARDAAYHQGTVWAWLIGPFIDAWLKTYPTDQTGARQMLQGFMPHLDEACAGSVSEIFDAESPFTPRGCIAQAWSVAELLRALVKTGALSYPAAQ
jgi:predicted glycogen debranching enzyme